MPYGLDEHLRRLRRQRERNALFGSAVSLLFLAAEFAAMRPGVVRTLNDPKRFGFEGQEQYVRRILLEQVGEVEQAGTMERNVVPVDLRRGGGIRKRRDVATGERPEPHPADVGVGSEPIDLQSRLRALSLQGPIIRSEDLVVDRLVRPEYPEEARDNNIEGLVEMVALVDTTGNVLEVHITGGSHQPLLERAATTAVLQCHYRPYRLNENAERVWAFYRISFNLY
ncbi:MAG TPA: energy transducer TonB [Candidatus Acidoferrales bacterium]|nr:energy transducer TonB [Candidatus Acidoferrales bacterium]